MEIVWLVGHVLHEAAAALWQAVGWDGSFFLTVIWLLCRRLRYAGEALRRASALRLQERNETWKAAFEIFTNAPPPRLQDLANDTESDWKLR